MKKTLNFCLFLLIVGVFCSPIAYAKSKLKQAFDRGLIIYSPPSLTNVMHKIIKDYSVKENIAVSVSFESSQLLAEKIEEGLPVNIFITENPAILKDLQQKGLLNVYSVENIISDRLVIVAPKNHYLINKLKKYDTVKDKLDFISKKSLIVIPDTETEYAGILAKKVFEDLNIWEDFKKSIIKASNTREALYLASKENSLALVYESDANSDSDVEILTELPRNSYPKIIYQAAIVADIESKSGGEDSEKFMAFLKSDSIKKALKHYGYYKVD
jgi:molybdate transport system substrate-binding protein